jgi:hypothetical protein
MSKKTPIPNCPKCWQLMEREAFGFFDCKSCQVEIGNLDGSGFILYFFDKGDNDFKAATPPCKTLEELFRVFQMRSFQ